MRLYYFCPIFRYERPQAGRYRQHHQFGIEAIGDGDPIIDAEVIQIADQIDQLPAGGDFLGFIIAVLVIVILFATGQPAQPSNFKKKVLR